MQILEGQRWLMKSNYNTVVVLEVMDGKRDGFYWAKIVQVIHSNGRYNPKIGEEDFWTFKSSYNIVYTYLEGQDRS